MATWYLAGIERRGIALDATDGAAASPSFPFTPCVVVVDDDWQYNSASFVRKLSPGIPGQSVDRPPFAHPERSVALVAIRASWQPDLWPFAFIGSAQPYAPALDGPSIPGRSVDQPPPRGRDAALTTAAIVAAAQPHAWQYDYLGPAGGTQPYGPRQFSPGIPGEDVDNPPFVHRDRLAVMATIKVAWQPDPWVYDFGGNAPFLPKQNSPAIPGQSADPPPFAQRNAQLVAEMAALGQPDPWAYDYITAGPFMAHLLPTQVPEESIDPLEQHNRPMIAYVGSMMSG